MPHELTSAWLREYQMARHDVGYAFLDELNKQGYAKPAISEVVRAGQHGVQVTYLRDMSALGHRFASLAPLIEFRDHGVSPAYIRELADLGYKGLPATTANAGSHPRRQCTSRHAAANRHAQIAGGWRDALV